MANALLDDSTQDLGVASGNNSLSLETTRLSNAQTVAPSGVQSSHRSPPSKGRELENNLPRQQRSNVLAPKSANLRVKGKGSKKVSKLQISHPSPLSSNGKPVQPNKGKLIRHSLDTSKPDQVMTSTRTTDLNKKISTLMQQADQLDKGIAHGSQNSQDTSKVSGSSKSSSIRKGREAFVRAKRAISERLSTSEDRKLGHKSSGDSNQDNFGSLPYQVEGDPSRQRLNRRIAEGENLGNPKIRSLTGDGNVPRKPLPVYESMRSRRRQSSSLEDPFLDDIGSNDSLSPKLDTVKFDSFGHNGKRNSTEGSSPLRLHHSSSEELSDTSIMSRPRPIPRYSPLVSGLTQHPDVMFFSSSPVEFSTPRVRLERSISPSGKKRLSAVSACSPSILDFSFERFSGDETDELQRLPERPRSPSPSLKRKTGRANLRSGLSPASKKTKGSKIAQDTGLTSGLAKLEASGNGSLTVRDAYKRFKNATNAGSKPKGFKIFDVGKGKQPIREIMDETKGPNNSSARTQSPNFRPAARHTRGQRSRSAISLSSTINEETTSMDELQIDSKA